MRIGVDAGCLGISDNRLKVGVYQVTKEILLGLSKTKSRNHYLLYSFVPVDKKLMRAFGPRMRNIVVRPSKGWLKLWLPLRLLFDRPDIFFGPAQALPLWTPSKKTITLIHDVAFVKHPEFFPEKVEKMRQETKRSLAVSDVVLTVSHNTKKDIIRHYGIPARKIVVVHPPVRKFVKKRQTKKKDYLLYIGALKASKNIPRIINAFISYIKENNSEMELVIVGGNKWMDTQITNTLNKIDSNNRKRIRFLGFVPEDNLGSLYANAHAFISPSLYEGFGLPLVEAIKMGTPVIAGERSSEKEIVGNAGILVHPKKEKEIVEAIKKIIKENGKFRKNARIQAKKFNSWKSIQMIRKVIEQ